MTPIENEIVWRSECPISSALDVLGDKWSLLVIRDLVVHGTRTYSDFRDAPEGIATNILATRLNLLSSLDLIERVDPERSARGNAYRLTERGAALRPITRRVLEMGTMPSRRHAPQHPRRRPHPLAGVRLKEAVPGNLR